MARIGDFVARRRVRRADESEGASPQGPRTAFVLSGGGVLGAIQVGQLTALLESGITPDIVVGTSVGSLNAAMVACSPTLEAMRDLQGIWSALRSEDVFPGSRVKRAWHIIARGDHIYPNDGIRRLIEQLPARSFDECRVPLHVCATNLRTGEERWFDRGALLPAILASTALPGIFPPVAVDGERYVDGGVVNNVPVSRAVEMGATRVFVLECGTAASAHQSRAIRRPLDVLVQAFAHSRAVRAALDLQRYGSDVEIVRVASVDPGFIRFDDLSHSRRLIARALEATREQLLGAAAAEA